MCIALLFVGALSAQKGEWKLAKSENGVKVFTRAVEGEKVKQFRAEFEVRSTLEKAMEILDDIERYPSWQDNCEDAELVKSIDDSNFIARYTSDTPWPFTDRDIVLRFKRMPIENNRLVYDITNAAGAFPEQSGYVRIPQAGGKWEIVRRDDGMLAVSYQFSADPGGSIPKWLVNMFIVQGPHNSMVRMRELLEN